LPSFTSSHSGELNSSSCPASFIRLYCSAVGLWGDVSGREHVWDDGKGYGPGRFFSIRSDEGMQEVLGRHGELEQWTTWNDGGAMHYQWAVLRVSPS